LEHGTGKNDSWAQQVIIHNITPSQIESCKSQVNCGGHVYSLGLDKKVHLVTHHYYIISLMHVALRSLCSMVIMPCQMTSKHLSFMHSKFVQPSCFNHTMQLSAKALLKLFAAALNTDNTDDNSLPEEVDNDAPLH
jgi:hypothetical protein